MAQILGDGPAENANYLATLAILPQIMSQHKRGKSNILWIEMGPSMIDEKRRLQSCVFCHKLTRQW
jgi:hypothetical protein